MGVVKTLCSTSVLATVRDVAASLIGVTDIARMLGVSQQRASQIVEAYDDFPEPVAVVGVRRAWDQEAIESWMDQHPDRRPGRPPRAEGTEGEDESWRA